MKMILVVLTLLSVSVSAADRKGDIQKLEGEFTALKFEVKADRAKGRLLMVKVLAQLERFHSLRQKLAAKDEFRALVSLVAASLPYDQGLEGPESLASLLSDNRGLKSVYEQAATGVAESCRQQFLKAAVDERLCMIEVEERGQMDQRPAACVRNPPFRYDVCVGHPAQD